MLDKDQANKGILNKKKFDILLITFNYYIFFYKEIEKVEVKKFRATSVRLYNNGLRSIKGLKSILD